jgi:indole-3-glycerol phosphate synthase
MAADQDILHTIAERTKRRVAAQILEVSIDDLAARAHARVVAEQIQGEVENDLRAVDAAGAVPHPAAEPLGKPGKSAFERALRRPGMQFICEAKKASPSKGVIAEDFDPVAVARDYEAAGAAAVSCLTEPYWFQGSDEYLQNVVAAVDIPVLRKDFVVDEYMIYQAKVLGAGAVLLIAAILTDAQLAWFGRIAADLGMAALYEAHDAVEVERCLAAGARVVGVNNRDLRTFTVDLATSLRLRDMVPPDVAFVSESGIRGRDDVARLEDAGVDAVLIGETLMRSPDKRAALNELRGVRA